MAVLRFAQEIQDDPLYPARRQRVVQESLKV
jgi:hypothetical protein